MKGERILYANDTEIAREGIQAIVEKYASKPGHEHQLVGAVSTVTELEDFLSLQEDSPTVFLFDPRFPTLAAGRRAAEIVRRLAPEATIVTLPSLNGVEFADYKLEEGIDVHKLVEFFTNLRH